MPCFDIAGEITAVGDPDGEWKVGDEVFGRIVRSAGMSPHRSAHITTSLDSPCTASGSLQQYAAVAANTAMIRKPPGLSWEQAAAIPLVYMTAYGCLVDIGHLPFRPSDEERGKRSVLILGGSGGAGTQSIQLAKLMGLNVVTSCSKASDELVKKLGADEVSQKRLAQGSLACS